MLQVLARPARDITSLGPIVTLITSEWNLLVPGLRLPGCPCHDPQHGSSFAGIAGLKVRQKFSGVTESEFLNFSNVIESFGPLIHKDLRIQIPLGIMWKIYLSPQLAWNSSIIPGKPLVLDALLQLRDLHAGNSACKTKFSNREG